MRLRIVLLLCSVLFISACRESRIHDHPQWGQYFEEYGIKEGCFIMRDNNHEAIEYYNKERCLERFMPASTFKIFNSLVALEIPIAADDQYIIPWDSVDRGVEFWNQDMNMRMAFKLSNIGYYQEVARRIGYDFMKHYVDSANYGNKNVSGAIDSFWINDTLQISADEQVGFLKRLYFNQLPFSERTQRIVRSMMLQEDMDDYKLYYKTGWGSSEGKEIIWVVGYIERIADIDEHENSMNKSDVRMYPYFFALNFEVDEKDVNTHPWGKVRIDILKAILKDFGAMPSADSGSAATASE